MAFILFLLRVRRSWSTLRGLCKGPQLLWGFRALSKTLPLGVPVVRDVLKLRFKCFSKSPRVSAGSSRRRGGRDGRALERGRRLSCVTWLD